MSVYGAEAFRPSIAPANSGRGRGSISAGLGNSPAGAPGDRYAP